MTSRQGISAYQKTMLRYCQADGIQRDLCGQASGSACATAAPTTRFLCRRITHVRSNVGSHASAPLERKQAGDWAAAAKKR
jgi:hypothetical protein